MPCIMIDKKVTFSQTLDNMIGNRLISRKNSNHHMRAVSIIIKLLNYKLFRLAYLHLYILIFFSMLYPCEKCGGPRFSSIQYNRQIIWYRVLPLVYSSFQVIGSNHLTYYYYHCVTYKLVATSQDYSD